MLIDTRQTKSKEDAEHIADYFASQGYQIQIQWEPVRQSWIVEIHSAKDDHLVAKVF